MGISRRDNEERSQTRAVIKLDFSMNFANGAAPTVVAQNECVSVTRDSAGTHTIQLLDTAKKLMRPGYPIELHHSYNWTNGSNNHVRWGNYNQALGTLQFTIHADGQTATAAADPANAANLNLRVRLRFKTSSAPKF